MKKFFVISVLLLAVGAFAAAQTTPTTPNSTNNGVQNPTQQTTPIPNPNAPPPPDVNVNPSPNPNQSGTTNSTGSANPNATTNKSGDADQNTATTPPTTSTTQDQTTTTTTTNTQTETASKSGKSETLVGCLDGNSNGSFTLYTKNKNITIVPSSMMAGSLSEHVGERVRARGSYSISTNSTAMNTTGNTAASALPQSDQPITSATGKSETDNPVKTDTRSDTRASGTAATDATTSSANAATGNQSYSASAGANREFRVDSISTIAKTCGTNNSNNPK